MATATTDTTDAPAAAPNAASAERLANPVERPTERPARGWAPAPRSAASTFLFILLAISGALVVLYAWHLPPFTSTVQTTDDAQVRGQTTVIAPQVNGYVTRVLAQDFQSVRGGQPLVQIDDRIYRQRVQQAEAQLAAQLANLANSRQSERSSRASVTGQDAAIGGAHAQLARAEADMRRVNELVGAGSVSVRERDQSLAALRQAQATVRQAEAQRSVAQEQVRSVTVGRGALEAAVQNARAALRLAQIDLENTTISAPQDGQVGEVGVRLGQYVTAGSQLLFLVPRATWVIANYRESQTVWMEPGQRAVIRVDALQGAELTGRVEQLAPAAGNEFSVIRPDNATGNFVKVTQRIAARISIDPDQPLAQRLRPGMSVEADVDTLSNSRGGR
jgi:multidrug resistance efflux pump